MIHMSQLHRMPQYVRARFSGACPEDWVATINQGEDLPPLFADVTQGDYCEGLGNADVVHMGRTTFIRFFAVSVR